MRLIPAKIWGEVYAEPYNFPNVLTYDCHNYLSGDWNVVSAAYGYPCFAKDGQALTLQAGIGQTMDSVIVWVIMCMVSLS